MTFMAARDAFSIWCAANQPGSRRPTPIFPIPKRSMARYVLTRTWYGSRRRLIRCSKSSTSTALRPSLVQKGFWSPAIILLRVPGHSGRWNMGSIWSCIPPPSISTDIGRTRCAGVAARPLQESY
jgi:hypothetical protein